MVEKTGQPLSRQFSLTNLWEGIQCGRDDCGPCHQGGDVLYPCFKRNLTYQSICVRCHPGILDKKGKLDSDCHLPSVYVGETARSLYERSKEHLKAYKEEKEDSHMYKHHQVHHGGKGETRFYLKPTRFHRTALTRQLTEAVQISRLGEGLTLNSKSEYSRCKIARLELGEAQQRLAAHNEGEDQQEVEDQQAGGRIDS